ncbi:MAG: hypothetical protein MZU97_08940 [Bacillus subtilis]|nr:hypothetical protein [Bacillus subtilis]
MKSRVATQRLVLQHPEDDAGICAEGLLPLSRGQSALKKGGVKRCHHENARREG